MRPFVLLLLPSLICAACGAVVPGGEASGFPDTVFGDPQRNMTTGVLQTSGEGGLRRDNSLVAPWDTMRARQQ